MEGKGYSRKVLKIKKNAEKKPPDAFLRGTEKNPNIKQSEWLPSNTLLICPLFPCQVEAQMSFPTSEGSVDHCDPLPRRIPYPHGDLAGALGVASFSPPPLKLFQPTLKCCAKRRARNWYIYFRYWTSAGSEGHFMPNLCSQSSREKDLNLELSGTGKHSVSGTAAYCVSCDLHQQPLSDCEPLTKIPSLFTLK